MSPSNRIAPRAACRGLIVAAALALLAGCALPRGGPSYSEVTAAPPGALPYEVVTVTPEVVALTRIAARTAFPAAFTGLPAADTSRIAPGDVLAVTVWENMDEGLLTPAGIGASALPRTRVDDDGNLFVPYAGLVPAAGLTVNQLRQSVRARLARQTLNPQVDLLPVGREGRKVSVQGRVSAPGLYDLEPSTARLVGMLAQAGGVTDEPEAVRIRLRRGEVSGEAVGHLR